MAGQRMSTTEPTATTPCCTSDLRNAAERIDIETTLKYVHGVEFGTRVGLSWQFHNFRDQGDTHRAKTTYHRFNCWFVGNIRHTAGVVKTRQHESRGHDWAGANIAKGGFSL